MDLKKINTKGLKNGDDITAEELLLRAEGKVPPSAPARNQEVSQPAEEEEPNPVELTGKAVEFIPATAPVNRFKMNKLESEYADLLASDDTVHRFWHHPFKVRLCDNQFYEVDFLVQYKENGRLEIHETKVEWDIIAKSGENEGKKIKTQRGRDDSRNKCRVIAALFPFVVKIMSRKRKKDGGGWHCEVLPAQGLSLIVGGRDGSQQAVGELSLPVSAG